MEIPEAEGGCAEDGPFFKQCNVSRTTGYCLTCEVSFSWVHTLPRSFPHLFFVAVDGPRATQSGAHASGLEQRCLHFLLQGLAPSSRTYSPAQTKFIELCTQFGKPTGSPCPADEWTLCLFVSFLDHSMSHKVSRTSCWLRGGSGYPGPRSPARLRVPSSAHHKRDPPDHIPPPGFIHSRSPHIQGGLLFGLLSLRAAEFPVPSLSTSSRLYTWRSMISPCVYIKLPKLIRSAKDASFILDRTDIQPRCALRATMEYLAQRNNSPGPPFPKSDGQPWSRSVLMEWLRQIVSAAGINGNYSAIVFGLEQLEWQQGWLRTLFTALFGCGLWQGCHLSWRSLHSNSKLVSCCTYMAKKSFSARTKNSSRKTVCDIVKRRCNASNLFQ